MKEPTVEIVTANKEIIAELRALDVHNRDIKNSHVEYLRREIREGRWRLTNHGVGVTVSGFICDGGHRLQAIELEGCPPVQFGLFRNLSDDAQKYVDQHAKRTMSDVLRLNFNADLPRRAAAVLNVILKQRHNWGSVKVHPDLMISMMVKYGRCVFEVFDIEGSGKIAAPVCAAVVEALHNTKDDRVLTFFQQVVRGEMLEFGCPALTLRNWLASIPGATGGFQVQRERYLKTWSALVAFLEGRKISRLYAREIPKAYLEEKPVGAGW